MVINTLELSDRQTPSAVVLSTSIKAKKGREGTLRNLLESLVEETVDNQKDLVFTCTVNQVTDGCCYVLVRCCVVARSVLLACVLIDTCLAEFFLALGPAGLVAGTLSPPPSLCCARYQSLFDSRAAVLSSRLNLCW